MNPLIDMNCIRCEIPMKFLGNKNFHEGPSGGMFTKGMTRINQVSIDLYACPQCGKIEFFLPETYYKDVTSSELSFEIELIAPKSAIPPSVPNLLKIKPGITSLDGVYKTIGHPVNYHTLDNSILLCYPSKDMKNSHIIVINNQTQQVRLVVIYNNETFTSKNLQQSYGSPESIDLVDGHEHLFFPGKGVGYLLEGRNEDAVLYVQIFEPMLNINEYIKKDGFSKEIFTCNIC